VKGRITRFMDYYTFRYFLLQLSWIHRHSQVGGTPASYP